MPKKYIEIESIVMVRMPDPKYLVQDNERRYNEKSPLMKCIVLEIDMKRPDKDFYECHQIDKSEGTYRICWCTRDEIKEIL